MQNPPIEQPLRLAPQDVPRIWGGSKFPSPHSTPIGERWLYSLLKGQTSIISQGDMHGQLIDQAQIGFAPPQLLVKIIDTAAPLSVQVHPDDALAQQLGHQNGKSEMWYILAAEPKSYLLLGLREDTDAETIKEAAISGKLPQLLNQIYPRPGDYFHVPAGQIHALGPGLQILEIQQTSDITYRLYDWNRTDTAGRPRPLDIPHALQASSRKKNIIEQHSQANTHRTIVSDTHFRVDLHQSHSTHPTITLPIADKPYLVIGLREHALFTWPADQSQWLIEPEELILLPPHSESIKLSVNGDFKCLVIK